MMSAQPAGPTFREGSGAGQGLVSGHLGRFSPPGKRITVGQTSESAMVPPQPSSDVASSFRDHDPSFHKLTPP
jgi:hypothetical protein